MGSDVKSYLLTERDKILKRRRVITRLDKVT